MFKALSSNPAGWLFEFAISSVLYLILFYLNDWLTTELMYGLGVHWIYLPAGLRLFLILVFGLPGALGIGFSSFLGTAGFFWASRLNFPTLKYVSLVTLTFRLFNQNWISCSLFFKHRCVGL